MIILALIISYRLYKTKSLEYKLRKSSLKAPKFNPAMKAALIMGVFSVCHGRPLGFLGFFGFLGGLCKERLDWCLSVYYCACICL